MNMGKEVSMSKKHLVCFSGGHSSALVAIEVVRKYGKENVVLLNHDISPEVEHEDIKRFKKEVAEYLGLEITYANMPGWETKTPLRVTKELKGFQFKPGQALCTYNLKTKPFYKWLEENCTDKENWTVYYGFDAEEDHRISRRRTLMRSSGYKTEFPLAEWERTIYSTEEIGIEPPRTYKIFKHANCIGCLKAGKQHWYVVYCLRPDIFQEAMKTEEEIGHSIIKGVFLKDLIPKFEETKAKGICPNDKENSSSFWARVEKTLPEQMSFMPCDCSFL